MTWYCIAYCLYTWQCTAVVSLLWRSFGTTELVSLLQNDRRIGTDTGCAGCRRVEKTVSCEEHTHIISQPQIRPCLHTIRYVSVHKIRNSWSKVLLCNNKDEIITVPTQVHYLREQQQNSMKAVHMIEDQEIGATWWPHSDCSPVLGANHSSPNPNPEREKCWNQEKRGVIEWIITSFFLSETEVHREHY